MILTVIPPLHTARAITPRFGHQRANPFMQSTLRLQFEQTLQKLMADPTITEIVGGLQPLLPNQIQQQPKNMAIVLMNDGIADTIEPYQPATRRVGHFTLKRQANGAWELANLQKTHKNTQNQPILITPQYGAKFSIQPGQSQLLAPGDAFTVEGGPGQPWLCTIPQAAQAKASRWAFWK